MSASMRIPTVVAVICNALHLYVPNNVPSVVGLD